MVGAIFCKKREEFLNILIKAKAFLNLGGADSKKQ